MAEELPPYAFVPGGPWPHPTGAPGGHSAGAHLRLPPVDSDQGEGRVAFDRGMALFDAGYYWEAHEVWEALWHAHGRCGPTADVLKGLIKLAAAGVKVRQGQTHGIVTHAARAAETYRKAVEAGGSRQLGFDLEDLIVLARTIAAEPPEHASPPGTRVARVFDFRLERLREHRSGMS